MSRVSIYELECFVAVAEELSFSRAAKRLNLTQPPLSRQIQSLETKLGMRLLNRNTRTVALTPGGLLYLEDARQILIQLDGAAASARRAATGENSRLRLAFVGALLDEGLVHLLKSFRVSRPQCQIHLTDLPPSEQLAALRAGQLDGAFIGAPPGKLSRQISTLIWKREPLLLAIPEPHSLVAKKSVPLGALQKENWVMVSRAAAPAFRRQFDQLCAKTGLRPRVVQESDRAAAVLTMVAAEQGISLLPKSMSRWINRGVVFRPLKGKQPMLEHAFAWRGDKPHCLITELLRLFSRR
ncbi:MAG TPA: LysR family transcriptional regulator [Verrucomicrobiae bacterium]|jgi:DNA-binding transcriptional LysR family regulator